MKKTSCEEEIKIFDKIYDNKIISSLLENSLKYYIPSDLELDLCCLYETFITNITDFYKVLDLKDLIEIKSTFEYMLWNGYFSKDNKLLYSNNRTLNLFVPGASIMTGKSNCFNNASMLRDILNGLEIDSYTATCLFEKLIEEKDNEIIRNEDTNSPNKPNTRLEKKMIELLGNHCITISKENNNIYVSDPTNLAFFIPSKDKSIISTNQSSLIDIKLFSLYMLNILDKPETKEIIRNFFNNETPYKSQEIKQKEIENLKKCKKYIPLFNKFYQENEVLINMIDKKLEKTR